MIKTNIDTFMMKQFYNAKSVNRAKNIIKNIDTIENNIGYQEVDTVFYIKNPVNFFRKDFQSKKIHLQVIYNEGSDIKISFAKKNKLIMTEHYNMVKDIEYYDGVGKEETIKKGEIFIVELDEAFKIIENNSEKYMWLEISKYGGIK